MSAVQPFHVSQLKSLASLVESEIERQILAGEIEAGQRVNELALSRRLGVSRGPVREALQGLRRAGLVEIVANRGAMVRSLEPQEALDLFDLRSGLLAVIAERAAAVRTREDLAALEINIADSEQALKAADSAAYYRLNLAFHDLIVTMSGMHRAGQAYRDAVKELHLVRRRGFVSSQPAMRASLGDHRTILAALKRRDADKAFAAARRHVLSGKERFAASLAIPGEELPT